MKTFAVALETHFGLSTTTLAHCWKVTRVDGMVFSFTDHDKDVIFGAVTYEAATAFNRSVIQTSMNLSVDNLELEGMLDSTAITEQDLIAGRWDYAQVEMFVVNWAAPNDGRDLRRVGWLGEVSAQGKRFIAELFGLTSKLQQMIGPLYSPMCRADLGDAQCGVDIEALAYSTTVGAQSGDRVITLAGASVAHWAGGTMLWTSGLNDGLDMEIRSESGGVFQLLLAMPFEVEIGDDVTITPGCGKSIDVCRDTYSNVLNFRGEPHVPLTDDVIRGPT